MSELKGFRIHITGIVQGVGFRPFVYGLARRLALTGWVRNTSSGVDIEVDGEPEALEVFTQALQSQAPPLSKIDSIDVRDRPFNGFTRFEIVPSQPQPDAFQPISPDIGICPDCWRELFDPRDRRYRYPFINCTNCGPRFTIIADIPYDRPKTTMALFAMCPDCAMEYHDPLDRRFHAQPVACPACGPHIWLENNGLQIQENKPDNPWGEEALVQTRRLLATGKIIGVKGLGGFHLSCDATDPQAVAELRRRKLRVDKPFAVMMPDVETVERHCFLESTEAELLTSRERPIVILRRRSGSRISAEVAPGQKTLGVMLPYTPLHYLLLERAQQFPEALVMTSGNLSEEPIAIDNGEARRRLAPLVDAFLMHNRDIRIRCDDAVMRVFQLPKPHLHNLSSSVYPLRRSRGYAPLPIRLPWTGSAILATGPELKNTFCLARDGYAFLSQYIGDLENYETLQALQEGISHFERLFRVKPGALAYDFHPDYLATRYALERAEREDLPAIGVQHHHAHIAACMAENGLTGETPVIGVAFDGTGYGDDGAVWGGEFLLADYRGYQRVYHLDYTPLLGGEKAIREPWRCALAWLHRAGVDWEMDLPAVQAARESRAAGVDPLSLISRQLESGLNAPDTSSMGRLFDAVSALIGIRQQVNYEAQAAIEMEARVDAKEEGTYPLDVAHDVIDARPLIRAVVSDLRAGAPVETMAARFHNSIVQVTIRICRSMRADYGINQVSLSGGVWQNMVLLDRTVRLLNKEGFELLLHRHVPANDGGVAFGQAVVGLAKLEEE